MKKLANALASFALLTLLVAPRIADANIADTITSHIDKIKEVYDPASKAYTAITVIIKFFQDSEPEIADLIEQFKQEVLNEIRSERDRRWAAAIKGLLDRYRREILMSPPPYDGDAWIVKLDNWLADADDTNAQLRDIISRSTHEDADLYLLAKAYNTLVLPYIAVMRMREFNDQDVRYYFQNLVLPTNEQFIGPYAFSDTPELPAYIRQEGKLEGEKTADTRGPYLAVIPRAKGGGSDEVYGLNDREYPQYDEVMQMIWVVNEFAKQLVLNSYRPGRNWFRIFSLRSDGLPKGVSKKPAECLYSEANEGEYSVVSLRQCGTSNKFLWQVRHDRYDEAKIVHWTGMCLMTMHTQDGHIDLHDTPRLVNCDNAASTLADRHKFDILWDLRGTNEGVLIRSLWLGRGESCCPTSIMSWPIQGGYLTPLGTPAEPQFGSVYNDKSMRLVDLCYTQEWGRADCPLWSFGAALPNPDGELHFEPAWFNSAL